MFLETAQKNLTPNRDRLVFFKDGEEFLPGIQALAAPGHTVGHTMFIIETGGKQLAYIGDLATIPGAAAGAAANRIRLRHRSQALSQTAEMLTMLAANRVHSGLLLSPGRGSAAWRRRARASAAIIRRRW